MERIEQIEEWIGPVSTAVRVRMLVALHTVNTSTAFSDTCANALCDAEDWEDLLSTLLRNAQVGPQILRTVSRLLSRRQPDHALAAYADKPVRIVRICDAVDDGTTLRVDQTAWSDLGEGPCLLIGLADPLRQFVNATARLDSTTIAITPATEDWLERHRLACPAFLCVAV